jgi:ribonuclease BN (tRNA processing enzyme)
MGVGRLVLVHVNPRLDDEADLLRFAQERFPASEVGRDGPLGPEPLGM